MQTPCSLTQVLWASSGGSQEKLTASQYREMSVGADAVLPQDCRRKAKKMKGVIQGTGGGCRIGGAETG